MKLSDQNSIHPSRPTSRQVFIKLLDNSLRCKAFRFARQVSESWLANFPGDLGVNLRLARTYYAENKPNEAMPILEKILALDPEYLEAYETLLFCIRDRVSAPYLRTAACIFALGGKPTLGVILPQWSSQLRQARQALESGQSETAINTMREVLALNPEIALADVTHLRCSSAVHEPAAVFNLSTMYGERFPDCLQIKLIMAKALLQSSEETKAVRILHQCAALDTAGQVTARLWGEDHHYRPLWPEIIEMRLEMAVPAAVAASMGWNQLPPGELQAGDREAGIEAQPESVLEAESKTIQRNTEAKIIKPQPEETLNPPPKTSSQEKIPSSASAQNDVPSTPPIPFEILSPAVAHSSVPFPPVPGDILPSGSVDSNVPAANPIPGDNIPAELIIDDTSASAGGTRPEPIKESSLQEVDRAFERLSEKIKQPQIGRSDGRFPVYVIFSTRSGLEKAYGEKTFELFNLEMQRLAESVRKRQGWEAVLFYPDDQKSMQSWDITPVQAIDPWKLKLALADLDRALLKKGQMIGALLIVGGPEIVPFHQLPNPTDDIPGDIVSDNPYATLDSNYFVPEWQIGRLPGETGSDPGLLLEQLRQCVQYHKSMGFSRRSAIQQILPLEFISGIIDKLFKKRIPPKGVGYTAEIWQRASIAAYRPVGKPDSMLVSPPTAAGLFKSGQIAKSSVGYFNLHGVENGSDWYGQRDTNAGIATSADYPVALRPTDIAKNGSAPKIVFSEACFGGYINKKTIPESIALKFKAIGTLAVVASTTVAYGSINTPLIAADLLANLFWKYVQNGATVGEALMKAKIDLAKEMDKRQGFLDGEDQKTLISFILYGDPLVSYTPSLSRSKSMLRWRDHLNIKTISDMQENIPPIRQVSKNTLNEIKKSLQPYLPGLDDAQVCFSQQVTSDVQDQQSHTKAAPNVISHPLEKTGNVVVTVSKQFQVANQTHRHFARVTVDSQGKLIKMSISR